MKQDNTGTSTDKGNLNSLETEIFADNDSPAENRGIFSRQTLAKEQPKTESMRSEAVEKYEELYHAAPIGYFTFDINFLILETNLPAAEYLGLSTETVSRTPLILYVVHEDKQELINHRQKLLSTGEKQICELKLRRSSGELFFALLNSIPVFNTSGAIIQIRSTLSDITAHREKEERKTTASMQTAIDSLFDPLAILVAQRDEQGKIVDFNYSYINESGCTSVGKSKEEILGRNFFAIFPGLESGRIFDAYCRVIQTGEPLILEEYRFNEAAEKKMFSGIYSIRVNKFNDGLLITWRDISESVVREIKLKAALKEKEVMLQEIHHRVKNNLQIVSSLLSLQSESVKLDEDKVLFEESRNRIKSMAMIHEKLYQSKSFTEVDFNDYVEEFASYLFNTYRTSSPGIRLRVKAAKVTLPVDLAVPCGLIINELISNTFKHAFDPGAEGEVTVTLSYNADNECELVTRDNGKGLPEGMNFRETETLGLMLVNNLADQLHGKLEYKYNNGAVFTLTFPQK